MSELPLVRATTQFAILLNSLPYDTVQKIITIVGRQVSQQYYQDISNTLTEITKLTNKTTPPQQIPELIQSIEQSLQQINQIPKTIQVNNFTFEGEPLVLAMQTSLDYIKSNVLPKIINSSSQNPNQNPGVITPGSTSVLSSPLVLKT